MEPSDAYDVGSDVLARLQAAKVPFFGFMVSGAVDRPVVVVHVDPARVAELTPQIAALLRPIPHEVVGNDSGMGRLSSASADPPPTGELRFRPEVGAESPIWDSNGHMVWLDSLPISIPLQAHLSAWACSAIDAEYDDDGDGDDALVSEGRRLFRQVQSHLGDRYVLKWDWEDGPHRDPFITF